MIRFNHPVFLGISYAAAFVWFSLLGGKRAVVFNLCLVPLVFLSAWWYSYYTHFGITVLGSNFAGNSMTLESLL